VLARKSKCRRRGGVLDRKRAAKPAKKKEFFAKRGLQKRQPFPRVTYPPKKKEDDVFAFIPVLLRRGKGEETGLFWARPFPGWQLKKKRNARIGQGRRKRP